VPFSPPQFELTEEEPDDRTQVISVRGELHATTASDFRERLEAAISKGKTCVVLDLSELEFLDSTGLGAILNGMRSVTRAGGRMTFACANPTILRLFEITKLDSTFEILGSRDEALMRAQRP
jgi:anti-sigma B factor antagonist